MRFLLWTALLLAFVASLGFLGVVGIYASYAKDLPDYTQLDRRRVFQTARILDRNGQLLGEFNDPEGGRRTLIPIERIPKALRDATVVPSAAIQRASFGTFVYAIKEDGTATVKRVTLGPAEGDRTAITEGVTPGDRVVLEGVDALREGIEVEIVGGAPAPSAEATPPPAKAGPRP